MLQQLDTFVGPEVGWFALSPMLTLLGGTLVLMLAGALTPQWPKGLYAFATATIAGAAGVLAMVQWDDITDNGTRTLVGGVIAFDTLSMFMTITICIGVILVAMLSDEYLRDTPNDGPEIYALYLVAAIGGVVMASANDLIVLFLGLETLSLAMYVLAASNRRSSESAESGIKYFVLGGFSSAFFLYGIALVYGATGSTNISEMVAALQTGVDPFGNESLALAGIALLIVGLGFKVAAVPFHVWVPDVYQGAPTPVTSFMASVGKVAAFAAMLRVLVIALPFYRDDWRPIVWTLALLTLVVGSVLAVVQDNVKRMLAYSSINHAGFILVGVEAAAHGAGEADPGPRDAVGGAVPDPLLGAGDRVVRRRHGRVTQLRWRHQPRLLHRARTPPPGAGVGVHRVPARSGRCAVHERLRRQVRCDPGGGRGRQLRDRHRRHGLRGHRRLPLSADHVHDVDVGSGRRRPAHRHSVLHRRRDRGRRGVHDRGRCRSRLADRRLQHRHRLRPLTR
jgi:hypothetical protein